MNWQSILVLVLSAVASRSASFPLTVGANHYLVNITQNAAPGNTKWADAIQVVFRIIAGQTGSFTVGVFSVSVQPLSVTPAVNTGQAPR